MKRGIICLLFGLALAGLQLYALDASQEAVDRLMERVRTFLKQDEAQYGGRVLKPRELVQRKKEWLGIFPYINGVFARKPLWNFVYNPRLSEGEIDLKNETADYSFEYAFQVDADLYSFLWDIGRQLHSGDQIGGERPVSAFQIDDSFNSINWTQAIFRRNSFTPMRFRIKASLADSAGKTIATVEAGGFDSSGREKPLGRECKAQFAVLGGVSMFTGLVFNEIGFNKHEQDIGSSGADWRGPDVGVHPWVYALPSWETEKFYFHDVKVGGAEGDLTLRIDEIIPEYTRLPDSSDPNKTAFYGAVPVIASTDLDWVHTSGIWQLVPAVHDTLAIYGCSSSKTETIPESINGKTVTMVLDGVKYSPRLPDTLKVIMLNNIPGRRNSYFSKVGKLTLPRGLEYIGRNVFMDSGINALEFPESAGRLAIDSSAFHSNKLKSVNIPGYVEYIGNEAFGPLQKLTLNEGTRFIGAMAFAAGERSISGELRQIVIPASVQLIGRMAFGSSLRSIEFKGTGCAVIDYQSFFYEAGRDRTVSLKLPAGFDPEVLARAFDERGFTSKEEYLAGGGQACTLKLKVGTGIDLDEK